jgi:putative ABC transport system substrate-binding protein
MSNFSPTDAEGQASIAAFLDTFQKRGWTDGSNIIIDVRWDAGDVQRMQDSAAELVALTPDLIVAATNPAVAELQRLTSRIPIVFTRVADPVGSRFVASLAHPGGNVTGFQASDTALGSKWLEVLKGAFPNLARAAVLFGSDSAGNVALLRAAEAGAQSMRMELKPIDVHGNIDVERALSDVANPPDCGLIVVAHPYTTAKRTSIIQLAARYRLPAIYPYRFFAIDGGLMSYGPDQIDQWRGAAEYADRILKGETPAQLPVQAPIKYQLVINLKTAKALGIEIPAALAAQADEVIE